MTSSFSSSQAQTAPKLLPFQGRLTTANGAVVPDGAKVVQFKIYDAPVGGQAVWNGEVQKLNVNGGLVNTLLGSKASLAAVDFNLNLYLEITIDANSDDQITLSDPPLLPRQAVMPAVFAKEAADSRKLAGRDWSALFGTNDTAGSLLDSKIRDGSIGLAKLDAAYAVPIPVGGVIMWWGGTTNLPYGFEICDGGPVVTPGASLTGDKPDLRDRFVKGSSVSVGNVRTIPQYGGTNIIPARTSGGTSITEEQMPRHRHDGTTSKGKSMFYRTLAGGDRRTFANHATGLGSGGFEDRNDAQYPNADHTHDFTTSFVGGGQTHDHAIASHDNRPAFLEMFFIIRVK